VIVSAISAAPIPWPLGRKGWREKLDPILTDELVRAVCTESPQAVQYWWGVRERLLRIWRRELGAPRLTVGTAQLARERALARLGNPTGLAPGRPPRMRLSPERAAELKRRALAGERQRALAQEFGVSRSWVSAIARGARDEIDPVHRLAGAPSPGRGRV
jgi:hypothetical protein